MNALLITLGILTLLAGIGLCVLFEVVAFRKREKILGRYGSSDEQSQKAAKAVKAKKWPVLLAVLGIALFIGGFSFKIVPTGYTGVRTTFGLIDQSSCMPGFNTLVPFVQKISLVNNKQQDLRFEERVWSETSEQTVVYMEGVAVSYYIVPESSAWIYAHVDNWIEKLIDQDIVSSSCKSASRMLDASVVTDRGTIEPLCQEYLQKALDEKYGAERVVVNKVIISNMDFEDSYNQAIAEKSAAIQRQQQQAIENQTNIDKAAAEAEALRLQAQGKADAEVIEAQGKAQAAEIIDSSVTDQTLRQDAIDKWNGQLPKYVDGSGSGTFGILDSVNGPDTE